MKKRISTATLVGLALSLLFTSSLSSVNAEIDESSSLLSISKDKEISMNNTENQQNNNDNSVSRYYQPAEESVIEVHGYFNIGEKRFEDGTFSYEYYLFNDDASAISYFLRFDEKQQQSLFDMSGTYVTVYGKIGDDDQSNENTRFVSESKVFDVTSISQSQPTITEKTKKYTDSATTTTTRPIPETLKTVVILSQYAGTTIQPHPQNYFEDRIFEGSDSLNQYWQDTSYGNISMIPGTIDSTGVVNWQMLPTTKFGYGSGIGPNEPIRRADVINLADSFIDFDGPDNVIQNLGPQIGGPGDNGDDVDQVIMVYNDIFSDGNYAFAFFDPVMINTDEGPLFVYLTHTPDNGDGFPVGINFENGVGVIAHEMGHNFEWRHTPPPTGSTYADEWSLMSGGGPDGPPGTISFNRDQANWIPSADKITISDGQGATLTLDVLSDPSPDSNYLMAIIPFGDKGEYYTLEARIDSTFDQTPQDQFGLLIYHYSPDGHHGVFEWSAPVNIVDTTNIGNFDNADLDLGESYTANNVLICHISQTDSTITVHVSNNAGGSCPNNPPPSPVPPVCDDLNQLNKIGNFEAALECYKQITINYPGQDNAFAQVGMAVALTGLQDFGQALDVISDTMADNPKYPNALNAKGMILYKKGDLVQSEKAYLQVKAMYPQNVDTHNGLGNIYRLENDMERAAYHYWMADKNSDDGYDFQKSQNADAKNGYGLMHQTIFDKTGDMSLFTALLSHVDAVRVDQNSVDGYNGIGNTLVKLGVVAGDNSLCNLATSAFKISLYIYPENRDALDGIKLANSCLKENNTLDQKSSVHQQDANYQKAVSAAKEILSQ